MSAFTREIGRDAALYLESCIHCGNCAEACPFYLATGEAKYTPIWKLEPLKQAYQREVGPFAWIYRTLGLKRAVTAAELGEWQELLYDSCTMCGRCTLVCPMGIDIASARAHRAPRHVQGGTCARHDLVAAAERAEREGSPLGATPKVLRDRIEWLADEHDVPMPLDNPQADVLVTLSSIEIMKYPEALVATARILDHAGANWTVRARATRPPTSACCPATSTGSATRR